MPVAFSSRESLRSLADDLGPIQLRIWQAIRDWPHPVIGPSIRDLATKLDLETATVSGRISELRKAGAIVDGPLKLGATGKRQTTYHACEWRPADRRQPAQLGLW